jgi:hypothetical protein
MNRKEAEERLDAFMKKVKVVSEEEAEKVDYVVCMPVGPSPFDNNLEADCYCCGRRIMHRPHVPKRPPKICIYCAKMFAEAGEFQQ